MSWVRMAFLGQFVSGLRGAQAVSQHFISGHEQTQLNQVWYLIFFDVLLASRGSSCRIYLVPMAQPSNTLSAKKQTTKFTSANFQKS